MSIADYLEVLRRRWISVLLVVLAVHAATVAITLYPEPQYTATTRLFFAVQGTESVSDLVQGSSFAEKQMTSYSEVAKSPLVLRPVIEQLGLDSDPADLAESVSAVVPVDTVILDISVKNPDATQAARIANAIGAEVSRAARTLSRESPNGSEGVRASTLAEAVVPSKPSEPNIKRDFAIGFALSLLAGLAFAPLWHAIDTKVRTEADVRSVTRKPIVGVVPYEAEVSKHPLILLDRAQSAAAEAVRTLRTNLQFVNAAHRPRSIVITSPMPGEGKSTLALNLAISLAGTGVRALLVDADLRRPSVADYLGLEGGVGLTTVLIDRAEVADVIQSAAGDVLDVLPAGQVPPNPSELLGSPAMSALLEQLMQIYDIVLMDSPPLLPVTDAAILSNLGDGALVVVGAGQTRRPQLRKALETLEQAEGHLFGIVLNKTAKREAGTYDYIPTAKALG